MPSAPVSSSPSRGPLLALAFGLVSLWALAASGYILLRDPIVATLVGSETQIQFAYEDRIAELRGALADEKARAAQDSEAQAIELQNLAVRGARLEAQTDRLAALVGADAGIASSSRRAEGQGIAGRFAALEARHAGLVGALTRRAAVVADRTQAALAELGVRTAAQAGSAGATGGPFVPLKGEVAAADPLSGLRDALARRRRLEAIAARVPLRQPVQGALDVTSAFGARRDPFLGKLAIHTGIDLRDDYGASVEAVAGGTVAIAGTEAGYGTMVEIDHGNGYATRYAHLSALTVKAGQTIAAGDEIGRVGTSGRSTGPHLHYEVRVAGSPVDPARYLELATAIAAR